MTEITMPRLSDSMEEGTILTWLKGEGETVARDDELLEVETDKATMTVTAEAEGVLSISVAEGTTVAVGTVIAEVAPAGTPAGARAPVDALASSGVGARAPAVVGAVPPEPRESGAPARSLDGADGGVGGAGGATRNGSTSATPLARRVAREHGVELDRVSGTGPRGRITRGDVFSAAGIAPASESASGRSSRSRSPGAAADTPSDPATKPDAPGGADVRELTRVQRVIAGRMTAARAAIPEFEVETEVRMDEALALRGRLRSQLAADDPLPSVNDLVVKAVALGLRRHPRLNATYVDDRLHLHRNVNVGVAVATEEALIVPTVRDADAQSLGSLAEESRRLAERVRAGTVTPAELSGATFTVSNLGMFGMTAIRPIINAPQVGILGVGAVRQAVTLADGEVVERRLMTLTLSCDHRAVYGADAARFLSEVRELLEAPLRLLM